MVKIIGYSSADEKICAAAGRISTQQGSASEIFARSQCPDKNANLISKVTASGHTSTVEHIHFNIAFENVSVVVEQFMIEFRLASFTVKSRRYVNFAAEGSYAPSFKNAALAAQFDEHVRNLFSLYSELTAAGVPNEDARFVLPYCFFSNFFCSLNGRELINVLRAMLYGRGSKIAEIKAIGLDLLFQAKGIAPGIFGNFEAQYSSYSDTADLSFINVQPLMHNKEKNVEILSHTPDAETLIAQTELINQFGLGSVEAYRAAEQNKSKILNAICRSSRSRALENASYTIRFNGVSLATLTHFSRHRMQTLLIPDLNKTDRRKYVLPQSVIDCNMQKKYENAFEQTALLFEKLCAAGETETVYCLLAGNTLSIVSVMNARQLFLFCRLRCCNRAQWEINALATEMLFKLRAVSPALFNCYGPSCYSTNRCPEGRLSCGKMKETIEKFKA